MLTIAGMALFTACTGNSGSSNTVGDTTKSDYDVNTKVDTSKTTSATGDASSIDNSGSGGTKIAKDSTKADSVKK